MGTRSITVDTQVFTDLTAALSLDIGQSYLFQVLGHGGLNLVEGPAMPDVNTRGFLIPSNETWTVSQGAAERLYGQGSVYLVELVACEA